MSRGLALACMHLQHLFDDVGEIRARGVVAAAVHERPAVLFELLGEGLLHARAKLALRDEGDAARLAVGNQAPRHTPCLVFRQQGELVELAAGVHRVGKKVERELRGAGARTGTTAATSSLVSGPTTNAAPSSTAWR